MSLVRSMAMAAFAIITLVLLLPKLALAADISGEYIVNKNGCTSRAFVSEEQDVVTIYIVGGQEGKAKGYFPGTCSIKAQGSVVGSRFRGRLVALEDDYTYFTEAEAAEESYTLEAEFHENRLRILSYGKYYCGIGTNFAGTYTKSESKGQKDIAGWYLDKGDVYSTVHVTDNGDNVTVALSGGHVGNAPKTMISGDCDVVGVGKLSGMKFMADFPPTDSGEQGGVSMTFAENQLTVHGADVFHYCGVYTRFYGVYQKYTCSELKKIFYSDLSHYRENPEDLENLCQ